MNLSIRSIIVHTKLTARLQPHTEKQQKNDKVDRSDLWLAGCGLDENVVIHGL